MNYQDPNKDAINVLKGSFKQNLMVSVAGLILGSNHNYQAYGESLVNPFQFHKCKT